MGDTLACEAGDEESDGETECDEYEPRQQWWLLRVEAVCTVTEANLAEVEAHTDGSVAVGSVFFTGHWWDLYGSSTQCRQPQYYLDQRSRAIAFAEQVLLPSVGMLGPKAKDGYDVYKLQEAEAALLRHHAGLYR